jgi:hypothetical protein
MKLRKLLTRINDSLRPVQVQGEGHAGEPDPFALPTIPFGDPADATTAAAIFPPGSVPSQQDAEPRH